MNNLNIPMLQGVISISSLLCLAAGWFNFFSPEINAMLSNIVFYILIGLSFVLASLSYTNQNHKYLAYAAAAMCITGPFLPPNLQVVKTIGLFAGIALTFIARPKMVS